jgi:GT2 family glycosyltransferase
MPLDFPSVSIVVLNWNGKQHLQSCLSSLLELDYPESRLEIILCDNGSIDGSVDFVQQNFTRVRVVALDRNYGFAEGNDRAARVAAGEWVGFLNNDMRVGPSWVKDMLLATDARPNVVCLASRILNWDGSATDFAGGGINYQGQGFQVGHGEPRSDQDEPRRLLFACGGAMLIKREVFLDVGGFDEEFFAFFEDVDLGWRLNLLGYDVWYVPAATALHRHHGTASRIEAHRLHVLYERNALAMIYKCFDDQNLAAALPAALLLLNERALVQSGLDRSRFTLVSGATTLGIGDGQGHPATEDSPAGSNAFAKGFRMLRQDGVRATTKHAARWAPARLTAELLKVSNRFEPGGMVLHPVAVSHYIGVSQFAHLLESLKEKRAWIQERRKRTDAEILPLFVDPFFAQLPVEQYVKFYRWFNHILELDERFGHAPALK